MMIKICTDIEQSKKLIELGLDKNTSDMCTSLITINGETKSQVLTVSYKEVNKYSAPDFIERIPTWSLATLMNLLPSEFTEKGEYSETTYKIDIRKYALTDDVDIYQIAYGNYHWFKDGSNTWSDMVNTGEKEDLLDAVFQMICWLKENNKI